MSFLNKKLITTKNNTIMKTKNIFSSELTSVLNVQNKGVISIAQIYHEHEVNLNLISVHQAFDHNLVRVEEVSESGSVNELIFINLSDKYIFIMDGDILKGAKQNRVVNSSVLVGPNKKIFLPVSCVEQGRWNKTSNFFSPSNELAHGKLRANKGRDIYNQTEKSSKKHSVSQSEVWEEVDSCMSFTETESPSTCLSDVFEDKKKFYTNLTDSFKINSSANGLAYFIDGNLKGVEIFHSGEIYSDYFSKILKSVALDADVFMRKNHVKNDVKISSEVAAELIYEAIEDFNQNQDRIDYCNGISLGKECRLVTNKEFFYDLTYENQTIHQSILSLEKDRENGFNRRCRTDNPITTFDFGDYNDTIPEVRRRNFFTRLFNRINKI